ncbi:hypothetical protein EV190_101102 [Actinorugispora endophytica]|uniref:TrbL/VirB6 plasmid conjugal transfer protein n=2 Tax=Actinorugispora endophytica TaxID=1605990 RepID=A0A4R6V6R4_9ACTN|nr:hypothetical protein EV190_101102 [Actinorugispora endophytica]
MLLGLLLKQVFVVLLISLLVMCYGLVMATDLGWGLQMILLALFTLALVVYRRPFANIFASVNANTFTSRMVRDAINSDVVGNSSIVLPPVAYMKAQKWGLNRSAQIAGIAASIPAGGGSAIAGAAETADAVRGGTATGESAEVDGTESNGEQARVRGTAGNSTTRSSAAPPPLDLNGKVTGTPARSGGVAPQRDSSQAPSLSGTSAASGGLFEGTGGSGAGSIPPRPSGGYTGTGDTGWGSVFGTGSSGSGQRAASTPRAGGEAPPVSGSTSGSGAGMFGGGGRTETPPQGSTLPRAARWAGPGTRGERRTPPPARPGRQAPPAPAPRASGGDGDNWLTGSGKSNDAPTSPFWAGEATRRRDPKRDVPFWLDSDD